MKTPDYTRLISSARLGHDRQHVRRACNSLRVHHAYFSQRILTLSKALLHRVRPRNRDTFCEKKQHLFLHATQVKYDRACCSSAKDDLIRAISVWSQPSTLLVREASLLRCQRRDSRSIIISTRVHFQDNEVYKSLVVHCSWNYLSAVKPWMKIFEVTD
jgi:hypothetical protein